MKKKPYITGVTIGSGGETPQAFATGTFFHEKMRESKQYSDSNNQHPVDLSNQNRIVNKVMAAFAHLNTINHFIIQWLGKLKDTTLFSLDFIEQIKPLISDDYINFWQTLPQSTREYFLNNPVGILDNMQIILSTLDKLRQEQSLTVVRFNALLMRISQGNNLIFKLMAAMRHSSYSQAFDQLFILDNTHSFLDEFFATVSTYTGEGLPSELFTNMSGFSKDDVKHIKDIAKAYPIFKKYNLLNTYWDQFISDENNIENARLFMEFLDSHHLVSEKMLTIYFSSKQNKGALFSVIKEMHAAGVDSNVFLKLLDMGHDINALGEAITLLNEDGTLTDENVTILSNRLLNVLILNLLAKYLAMMSLSPKDILALIGKSSSQQLLLTALLTLIMFPPMPGIIVDINTAKKIYDILTTPSSAHAQLLSPIFLPRQIRQIMRFIKAPMSFIMKANELSSKPKDNLPLPPENPDTFYMMKIVFDILEAFVILLPKDIDPLMILYAFYNSHDVAKVQRCVDAFRLLEKCDCVTEDNVKAVLTNLDTAMSTAKILTATSFDAERVTPHSMFLRANSTASATKDAHVHHRRTCSA